MRTSLLPLIFFLLPVLEIATFIAVGRYLGILATLGLIFLTSLAGMALLRTQGIGVLNRLRDAMRAGESPEAPMVHGALIVFAGLLLIIPGFITDAIGFLLFIPAFREFAWSVVGKNAVRADVGYHYSGAGRRNDGKTIDLDADDYSSRPNPSSPWLKKDDD